MQGNATPDNPKEYDFVERYQSNLPLNRVKDIRLDNDTRLKNENLSAMELILCGYIDELTRLNNNQQ